MARIRSIKPEFWEDDVVGSLTPLARLLFIGSWNAADDEGLLRWTPDFLNASFFMYDALSNKRVQQLMNELVENGLVFPYSGGKTQQRLAYVVNFRRHQKINRAQPGKFPPPSIQNRDVQQMYGRRDRWTCHLCSFPILLTTDDSTCDLALSLDHVEVRIAGGSDYPSNIRAAHISCNKARRDKAVEDFIVPNTVLHALHRAGIRTVTDSPTDSVNGSPLTRAGASADQGAGSKEQGGGSGSSEQVAPPAHGGGSLEHTLLDEHLAQRAMPGSAAHQMLDRIRESLDLTEQNPEPVRAALDEWRRRPGAKPGLLPHLVGDQLATPDPDALTPDELAFIETETARRAAAAGGTR
ncbi:MAG: hypothetical protein JWM40_2959 [Frankiales bacterium]|nr:hypothetical protein [Frankiales bacterium]